MNKKIKFKFIFIFILILFFISYLYIANIVYNKLPNINTDISNYKFKQSMFKEIELIDKDNIEIKERINGYSIFYKKQNNTNINISFDSDEEIKAYAEEVLNVPSDYRLDKYVKKNKIIILVYNRYVDNIKLETDTYEITFYRDNGQIFHYAKTKTRDLAYIDDFIRMSHNKNEIQKIIGNEKDIKSMSKVVKYYKKKFILFMKLYIRIMQRGIKHLF